ncbi:MAG: hypothetical protein ACLSAH_16585 [Bilophila wadsworthia]
MVTNGTPRRSCRFDVDAFETRSMGSASSTLPSGFSLPNPPRLPPRAFPVRRPRPAHWAEVQRDFVVQLGQALLHHRVFLKPSDTRAVPRQRPSSTFSSGVTSSSSPIFGAAFNAETSTSSRKSSRGSAGRHRRRAASGSG